jgi:hypothetical protein
MEHKTVPLEVDLAFGEDNTDHYAFGEENTDHYTELSRWSGRP